MEIKPPPGVEVFDHNTAIDSATRNLIIALYGNSKTGKTHFAVRAERPLYMIYLDPNTTLDYHLLKAETEFPGPVFKLVLPPVPYENLTQDESKDRVKKVKDFVSWAKAQAFEDVEAGKPAGTLVIDGCTMLRGYFEKAILGESALLGYRAEKGQRGGPSTYDYAKSNGALRDFISSFYGAPLDVILIWEGRPDYQEYYDGDVKKSRKTGKFHTTMPDRIPYTVNAEVETVLVVEDVVESNEKKGTKIVPKLRIGYNSFDLMLWDRLMPAKGFSALKRLFLVDLPEKREEMLDPIQPVRLASLPELGGDE